MEFEIVGAKSNWPCISCGQYLDLTLGKFPLTYGPHLGYGGPNNVLTGLHAHFSVT